MPTFITTVLRNSTFIVIGSHSKDLYSTTLSPDKGNTYTLRQVKSLQDLSSTLFVDR